MAETQPLIYSTIPKVMAEIGAVAKSSRNEQQKYAFRGIDSMYNAIHPALAKHSVFCVPEVIEREDYRFEKANYEGKTTTWLHVALKVRHRFYASDGSFVDVITAGDGLDNSDKAVFKAMSGAMKYAFIELFSVPTDDVEDADRTSPEQGTRAKAVPVTTAPVRVSSPVKLPDRPPEAPPAIPPDTAFPIPAIPTKRPTITAQQGGIISRRFRESLREELRPQSERLKHDALRVHGYIDELGTPTTMAIPVDEYEKAGKELCKFAREL